MDYDKRHGYRGAGLLRLACERVEEGWKTRYKSRPSDDIYPALVLDANARSLRYTAEEKRSKSARSQLARPMIGEKHRTTEITSRCADPTTGREWRVANPSFPSQAALVAMDE
jgi:hypothetical protein